MIKASEMTFDNFDQTLTTREVFSSCRAFALDPWSQCFTIICCSTKAMYHLKNAVINCADGKGLLSMSFSEFVGQLIDALRNYKTANWREKINNVPVLLIDDLQFAAGKSQTQEEIYQVIKRRAENNKPTILFLARSVRDLDGFLCYVRDILSVGCIADAFNSSSEKPIRKEKPYEGNEPYIFVSYSHLDTYQAASIISALQDNGYRVWYDEGVDPGTEWDENIASHVERCAVLVALVSANYLKSDNCKDELNFARDLSKDRLLIYLEDVALPAGMAMRLNRLQAIHEYAYETFDGFIEKLISADIVQKCKNSLMNPKVYYTEFDPEMFIKCVEHIIEAGECTVTEIMREFKIGYARAYNLVEEMEEQDIISPFSPKRPRAVLISKEEWAHATVLQKSNDN